MSAVDEVIGRAYAMRGVRYVLGAESQTAVDCSGLIHRIFTDSGHGGLVGTTRKLAAGYTRYFAARGMFTTNLAAAQRGDLISYRHGGTRVTHIGIYVGNNRVVSALTTTGVTEHRLNGLGAVTYYGVCLVPYSIARTGGDDPGDDGDEEPADPDDGDFNNQPPDISPVDNGIGYTPNVAGEWNLPIRRMEITFPTPTDAMFKLTLGDVFDQAFLGIDPTDDLPPSTPPIVPPDDGWWTEMIPVPVTSPGFGFSSPSGDAPIENLFRGTHRFMRRNEDGDFTGTGGGIYSSVGIKNGFLANVTWPFANCGGIGLGAYNKWEDSEQWHLMVESGGAYEDHPYGFPRTEIIENGIDYEIVFGEMAVTGYAPSFDVGVAYGDATAGRYRTAHYFGTLMVDPPSPLEGAGARTVNLGSVVIPAQAFASLEDMWLVITPSWDCQRDGFYCDPSYYGGPVECFAVGPRCTGEGNSGVLSLLTMSGYYSQPVFTHTNNLIGGVSWVGPTPDGQSTIYRTQYPYVAGTLTVQWQGVTIPDAHEYDPSNGLFILSLDNRDQASFITVTYRRADFVVTNPFTPQLPPGGGEPFIPPPGNALGSPYRPANQRQFGWGTVYDAVNCNMACAAMALDRHTLGRFTRYRGSPQNTPPAMRAFSGAQVVEGTSQADTTQAWSNGWGQSWTFGGPQAWSTMVTNIASGRGCTLFGRYAYMADRYKKSRTFAGPHAIYINEQLADGSFWGYDPIVGYPITYPYEVLKTYAESYYGFSGRVHAGFTRVTPNV